MAVIHDPNGPAMSVNDENQAQVFSVGASLQHHAAHEHGEAYTMDIDNVVCDADGNTFVYIQNTDDKDLIITSITLWVASNKDDSNVEAYVGHILTAVANETAVTPSNVNPRSGNSASGIFYVNDGAGNLTTLTGGVICGRWKPTTTVGKWEKKSGWVIPKNQTFTLQCTKDNTFRGYISFYYH